MTVLISAKKLIIIPSHFVTESLPAGEKNKTRQRATINVTLENDAKAWNNRTFYTLNIFRGVARMPFTRKQDAIHLMAKFENEKLTVVSSENI